MGAEEEMERSRRLGNWDGILRIRMEARRLGLALSALSMAARRRASGRDHPRGTPGPTPIRPWAIPAAACSGWVWAALPSSGPLVMYRRGGLPANTILSCGRFTESARWVGQKVG